MLITQDDIQRIGDEATLLHFLEEKLNLPIPEGLTLKDITINYSKFALGLSGVAANQVLDCQELIVSPGQPSGIFLIRFNSESDYTEALRAVATGLDKPGRDPMDLRFICMNECFQPFAFANFKDSGSKDWQTAILNIRAWTQENTHIHTSSRHELPIRFFRVSRPIKPTSPKMLLTKLENIGTPLNKDEIHIGIVTGYNRGFVIDESIYKQLLAKDPSSSEIIKRLPKSNGKWRCTSTHLICIPSSKIRQWPWSDARNESEAKRIFKANYPAVSTYLDRRKNQLKNRAKVHQGKFYWELRASNPYSMTDRRKIIYPVLDSSMKAIYDTLKGIPVSSLSFITTLDISLLAILNSKLFDWYARKKFRSNDSKIKALKFTKKNMVKAPIAPRTEAQKAELSSLVQLILDNPDSPKVPDIEREIDQLVYKLYELTPAEITLMEEETNK